MNLDFVIDQTPKKLQQEVKSATFSLRSTNWQLTGFSAASHGLPSALKVQWAFITSSREERKQADHDLELVCFALCFLVFCTDTQLKWRIHSRRLTAHRMSQTKSEANNWLTKYKWRTCFICIGAQSKFKETIRRALQLRESWFKVYWRIKEEWRWRLVGKMWHHPMDQSKGTNQDSMCFYEQNNVNTPRKKMIKTFTFIFTKKVLNMLEDHV